MDLLLENVRCFYGEHRIPIRPLTLFVGENSSGKTTALAMLSAALSLNTFALQPDFNVPPFELGSFETIASRDLHSKKPTCAFAIGVDQAEFDRKVPDRIYATFIEREGQPHLGTLEWKVGGRGIRLQFDEEKSGLSVSLDTGNGEQVVEPVFPVETFKSIPLPLLVHALSTIGEDSNLPLHQSQGRKKDRRVDIKLDSPFWLGMVSSVAPIRTKPSRIYETRRQFAPEGDHIPFLLAELCQRAERKDKAAEKILAIVQGFGEESGLFTRIDTMRLEDKPGAPFRLMVDSGGLSTNLTDVGYGISQVLPVLLEAVLYEGKHWVLMQQPEVHLHPRAQAALGTLLTDLVSHNGNKLVVETHSDFIIDRIRQEVAKGTVQASDVSLLYFERTEGRTTVHAIDIDESGNLVNPPDGYRQFFLEEELNLLTGGAR